MVLAGFTVAVRQCAALDATLVRRAERGLERTVRYLTKEVALEGGYAWAYLPDLSKRWGRGPVSVSDTVNVMEAPGTPSMGFAFLRAWEATGDAFYLDAAVQVANCLAAGQLECGGWGRILGNGRYADIRYFFRRNRDSENSALKTGYNYAELKGATQMATRLLIAVDDALGRKNERVHEAAIAGLDLIVAAQHSSGGWPHRFPLCGDYRDFLTFNDDAVRFSCDAMLIGFRAYRDPRYRRAFVRCGDFLIESQLPEPHPIWAQQYDFDLEPAWARAFEPPAACSVESIPILFLLMDIALATDDPKYLAPIPRALDWYKRSALPDGRYARYYELKTNRPLYFAIDAAGLYQLTYDDANLPGHYAFKAGAYPRKAEEQYEQTRAKGLRQYKAENLPPKFTPAECKTKAETMEPTVARALDEQDRKGRWVTPSAGSGGDDMLVMRVFQERMRILSDYLESARGASGGN